MGVVSYDEIVQLSSGGLETQAPKPFYALGKKPTSDAVMQWLSEARAGVWDATRERANKQITMAAYCRGMLYDYQDPFLDFRDPKTRRYTKTSKLAMPEYSRYVNTLTAKMNKYHPAVQVGPYTNEFDDKEAARVAQKVIDSLDTSLELKKLKKKALARALKFGEQFVWVEWCHDRGPTDPQWEADRKKYKDEKVKIQGKGGKESRVYDPHKPKKAGTFKLDLPLPWDLLIDPQPEPSQVKWVMRVEQRVHLEDVKLRYPNKAALLDDTVSESKTDDFFTLYHFWHRSCKGLPCGKKIVWTDEIILSDEDNPLCDIEAIQGRDWGDLPIVRLVDLEMEGDLHGFSSLWLVSGAIQIKNRLLSMTNRNYQLGGHPKWLVHENAKVQLASLGNDVTVVKWRGQVPPTLAVMGTIPPGTFEFYGLLGNEIDKAMNVHPVSSGTPPPGIKAGVAIRLLEEIEETNLSNLIDSVGEFSLDLAKFLIALSGKYMQKGAHLIRIVGETEADVIEQFEPELLTKKFNLTLDRMNQMARSPAARMQQVIDLVEVVKDSQTQEQILDAMDLISPDKITDPATAAVSMAEYENELCGRHQEMPEPREGERLTVHWNVHMGYYQRPAFTMLPEKTRGRFREHLVATEYLMSNLAMINPMYEQEILSLPGFPAFYHLPPEQVAKRQMLINAGTEPQQAPPPPPVEPPPPEMLDIAQEPLPPMPPAAPEAPREPIVFNVNVDSSSRPTSKKIVIREDPVTGEMIGDIESIVDRSEVRVSQDGNMHTGIVTPVIDEPMIDEGMLEQPLPLPPDAGTMGMDEMGMPEEPPMDMLPPNPEDVIL